MKQGFQVATILVLSVVAGNLFYDGLVKPSIETAARWTAETINKCRAKKDEA